MIENKEQSSKAGEIPEEFRVWYIGQSHKELTSEAYKEWKRRGQKLCYEVAYTDGYQEASEAAYRHLKAQPSPVLRWVSVETGLPEDNERIIFYTTGYSRNEMRMGSFVKKDQWERENMFIGDGYFHEQNVSHWMPVPQEPDPTHTAQ